MINILRIISHEPPCSTIIISITIIVILLLLFLTTPGYHITESLLVGLPRSLKFCDIARAFLAPQTPAFSRALIPYIETSADKYTPAFGCLFSYTIQVRSLHFSNAKLTDVNTLSNKAICTV